MRLREVHIRVSLEIIPENMNSFARWREVGRPVAVVGALAVIHKLLSTKGGGDFLPGAGAMELLYTVPVVWAAVRLNWLGGVITGLAAASGLVLAEWPDPVWLKSVMLPMLGSLAGWLLPQEQAAATPQPDPPPPAPSAGAAKQLRTSVDTLRGAATLLGQLPSQPQAHAACLAIMLRECEHMTGLLSVSPHPPPLDAVIAAAIPEANRAQVRIRKRADTNSSDPAQSLTDLLRDAIHAAPPGGEVAVQAVSSRQGWLVSVGVQPRVANTREERLEGS